MPCLLANKHLLAFLFSVLFLFACGEVSTPERDTSSSSGIKSSSSQTNILDAVQETGKYTTKDSVAAYIHKFQKLPSNYVNKATGQALYEEYTGNTWTKWNFNPWLILGVMIGGDYFGNDEGLLPTGNYKECDVDYHDSSRGTKRLVYTDAGLVYYTANHYESFNQVNWGSGE